MSIEKSYIQYSIEKGYKCSHYSEINLQAILEKIKPNTL